MKKIASRGGVLALALVILLPGCQTPAKARRMAPENGDAVVILTPADQAALRANRFVRDDPAEAGIRQRITEAPDDKDAMMALAYVLLREGDLKGAETWAAQALAIDSGERRAAVVMAHCAFLQGRYLEARRLIKTLGGASSPECDVLNLAGQLEWMSGKHERAEKLFRLAVLRDADYLPAQLNLGLALLDRKRYQAALRHIHSVLAHNPASVDALTLEAAAYVGIRDYDRAEIAYRDAAARAPDNHAILFDLALMYRQAGRFAEAMDTLQDYLGSSRLSEEQRDAGISLFDEVAHASPGMLPDDQSEPLAAIERR